MPPIGTFFFTAHSLYRMRCVGVSLEGFSFPSTIFPSRSTTTMLSAVNSSYGTPLGFIANTPRSLSNADTFPHVYSARCCAGICMFASYACSFNDEYSDDIIYPQLISELHLLFLFIC